jgi:hypothetical protein
MEVRRELLPEQHEGLFIESIFSPSPGDCCRTGIDEQVREPLPPGDHPVIDLPHL